MEILPLLLFAAFIILIALKFSDMRTSNMTNDNFSTNYLYLELVKKVVKLYVISKKEINYEEKQFIYRYFYKTFNIDNKKIFKNFQLYLKTFNENSTVFKDFTQIPHKFRLKALIFAFNLVNCNKLIEQKDLIFLQYLKEKFLISDNIFSQVKAKYIFDENKFYNQNYNAKNEPNQDLLTLESACKLLNVCNDFSEIDLKKAYRKYAKRYHPDSNPSFSEQEREDAIKQFQQITQAYQYIKQIKNFK